MITRCPMCTGKKTIMGLGCIIKKCPNCNGIGHIKVEQKKDVENDTKSADVVKIDRRKKEFRESVRS